MSTVIRIIFNEALGQPSDLDGTYIRDYMPDTDPMGRGNLTVTHEKRLAKRFSDFHEAASFWKQQSKRNPLRPDGKPNRPLTAYTVEFERVEDAN